VKIADEPKKDSFSDNVCVLGGTGNWGHAAGEMAIIIMARIVMKLRRIRDLAETIPQLPL